MSKKKFEIPVVYEDDDLIIINKPAGIVVNRSDTYTGYTVQDWMEERVGWGKARKVQAESEKSKSEGESIIFGDPEELFTQRSGIIHRLDRETSGIMMIAKTPAALIAYMSQFKQREVSKTYLALVHGKMSQSDGIIDLPIGRNSGNRLQFAVREGGKESRTTYRVVQYYVQLDVVKAIESQTTKKGYGSEDDTEAVGESSSKRFAVMAKEQRGISKNFKRAAKIYQGFSFVEVTPATGRTHQIRVHFSHMKHPLVGDKVYSGSKRKVTDQFWCPRHFLHAYSITFYNIRTKTEQKVSAPVPKDLEKVIALLVT